MNKIKSRKFQVWIVWLVFCIASLFIADLPKETIFNFFGWVSIAYIGGNVAQKYIYNKPTITPEV